jgi:hypothetical protein
VTETYPEKMEVNPEEMKSVVEHEEVPMEEAAVKPVRALKKWHGDRNLAAGHCQLAEGKDSGQCWVLEDVGCCLQRDDLLCPSCMA